MRLNEPIERLLSNTSGHFDSRESRFAHGRNDDGPSKAKPMKLKDCEKKNATPPLALVRWKLIGEAVKFNKS